MTEGQQAHLFASLVAFEELVRQIERVGAQGKSPMSGQSLTPMPAQVWQPIERLLAQAHKRLEQAVQAMAPDHVERREAQEGLGATLFWLAILIRQLSEEIIDDLEPCRIERKFGGLDERERQQLEEVVGALRHYVSEVTERLEAVRRR
ncbi:MAG: hypothetical protein ACP5VE_13370 [Chthonomonadales bacterium]